MPAPSGTAAMADAPTDGGDSRSNLAAGVMYAIAAYLAWGLSPLYFKSVDAAPAMEVLAHRVVWSIILLGLLVWLKGRWPVVRRVIASRRCLLTLALTTFLIGGNWFLYIWAVSHDHILHASLGYYINPLVNVALGVIFLKERLTRVQIGALALAGAGVAWMALSAAGFPWISIYLALSFGFYALVRKKISIDSITGLAIETALLLPAAIVYLAWLGARGESHFLAGSLSLDILLPMAGVVTTLPLLWFTEGARRLRLTTMGILQYIAPTGQFLLAVAVYGEAFTSAHAVAFACIWGAIALYWVDAARARRRRPQLAPLEEPG